MADESIAVCSLPNLINDLMGSDRFLPDREAYVADRTEELRELNEQGREMSQRLSTMTPEDPGAQELFESVQRLREQIARKQAENAALVETFTATQLSECNDLVRSSARAVAEDLGYAFVIASADPDEDLSKQSVEVLLRQLTSRPVIMFPEDNDITSDVRDDLKLE